MNIHPTVSRLSNILKLQPGGFIPATVTWLEIRQSLRETNIRGSYKNFIKRNYA